MTKQLPDGDQRREETVRQSAEKLRVEETHERITRRSDAIDGTRISGSGRSSYDGSGSDYVGALFIG